MKIFRRAIQVILFSAVIYSCKKNDLVPDNKTVVTDSTKTKDSTITGGGGTSPVNNIVYNLNKATLLQLVNNVRKSGCNCGTTAMPPVAAVTWSDQLAKAAYNHSVDMKTKNYFSHTGLDGSTPGDRITAARYNWRTYGENIALGYTTEQSVMNGWLNSEGHCKNIMNKNFKEMGAGREGNYWTQVFGAK